MPGKPKVEEPSKTKAVTIFLTRQVQLRKKFEYSSCNLCKGKYDSWMCSVYKEKTPTQRAKLSAGSKLCFYFLQGNHAFRKCHRAKNCSKTGCTSTHRVLLHGAERVYFCRTPDNTIATQDPMLVKQELMQARIKRTQTLIEIHSARVYQKNVRIMHTLTRFVGCKLERRFSNHYIKRVTAYNQTPSFHELPKC